MRLSAAQPAFSFLTIATVLPGGVRVIPTGPHRAWRLRASAWRARGRRRAHLQAIVESIRRASPSRRTGEGYALVLLNAEALLRWLHDH